jgi:acetyltransferase-like isoleucine patch superfamily enzyme
MGAGSITSNVKADKTHVHVKADNIDIDTGLKKFGAMLGDHVEIGCNSVLNPGTVICNDSNVYPTSMVRGVVPPHSIYKAKDDIAKKINE